VYLRFDLNQLGKIKFIFLLRFDETSRT
jgi:hypothetical protein